jgi:hypothetical protein
MICAVEYLSMVLWNICAFYINGCIERYALLKGISEAFLIYFLYFSSELVKIRYRLFPKKIYWVIFSYVEVSVAKAITFLRSVNQFQFAWYKVSAAKWMSSALFWVVTQRIVAIPYRRFRDIGSIFKGLDSYWISWPLKMGPIVCPETSVTNYHYMPRKISKDRGSQFLCRVPIYMFGLDEIWHRWPAHNAVEHLWVRRESRTVLLA